MGTRVREPEAARVTRSLPEQNRIHWSPRIRHALARRQDILDYCRPIGGRADHGLVRYWNHGHKT